LVFPAAGGALRCPQLQLNKRARLARAGAIKEQPHAKGFGALYSNEAYLAPDVIAILESRYLRLVVIGISFKTGNAFLDRFAKP
jgi:hypothetical protein